MSKRAREREQGREQKRDSWSEIVGVRESWRERERDRVGEKKRESGREVDSRRERDSM